MQQNRSKYKNVNLYFRILQKDISYYPLKLFWYTGYHPDGHFHFRQICFYVGFYAYFVPLYMAAQGIVISYKTDIFFTVECLQTCILFVHTLGKHIILHLQSQTIRQLLQEPSKFWDLQNFQNYDLRQECVGIFEKTRKLIYYYLLFGIVVLVSFIIQPFTTGDPPTMTYIPNGYFVQFSILYACVGCFTFVTAMGTDVFFCSLCIPVLIQFKLLAHRFRCMVQTKEMKELVKHHDFLLGYCRKVNEAFNGIFLLYFVISIAAACMQIFIFTQKEFQLVNRIKCLLYFAAEVVQAAIYCINAELISKAATQIADAVYEGEWYKIDDLRVRKSITQVISRTQKIIVFSGYGLVKINMGTFVTIFKTAMSFYTYLKSVDVK